MRFKTIYTLCVFYKDSTKKNSYIDFEDKELAKRLEKGIKEDNLIAFTDIIEFNEPIY